MKKKLFLVLCSCFAGALALSSCGGGGGGGANVPEQLKYFVNGAYEVVFVGADTVKVSAYGQWGYVSAGARRVEVAGVPVRCEKNNGTARSASVAYTMLLDDQGIPTSMTMAFSDFRGAEGDNEEDWFPVDGTEEAVLQRPDNGAYPYSLDSDGATNWTGVRYYIVRRGVWPPVSSS